MLIIHVPVRVKPESIEAFKAATMVNGRNSVLEPGIARFEVVQRMDDPSQFYFVEAYRTPQAALDHKETAHYKLWRDTVAPMMAEPRSSVKYTEVFPADTEW
ncbi:MAG: antibiotic biosynthesis monooxygenase [Bryobacteraceae bacterium]